MIYFMLGLILTVVAILVTLIVWAEQEAKGQGNE